MVKIMQGSIWCNNTYNADPYEPFCLSQSVFLGLVNTATLLMLFRYKVVCFTHHYSQYKTNEQHYF